MSNTPQNEGFREVTETGTSFTLNRDHIGALVFCSNAGTVTITVNTGTVKKGEAVRFQQIGGATMLFSFGGGMSNLDVTGLTNYSDMDLLGKDTDDVTYSGS